MRRALLLVLLAGCAKVAPERRLQVCADPNNFPFSDQAGRGFENRIAELLGQELHARVAYTWWAQRRGFFRSTLGSRRCDVVIGVPTGFERVLTTRPYYRSSYVFVTRGLELHSLDDPRLEHLKIGVQLIGDDGFNTPPSHGLARRGLVDNVTGFVVYGDYGAPSPPANIIDAVQRGEIDVGLVWGPLAGALAKGKGLRLTEIEPGPGDAFFAFDISVGVRKGDRALEAELQQALDRRRAEIDALLREYGVPLR